MSDFPTLFMKRNNTNSFSDDPPDFPLTPAEIVKQLDEYVVGQTEAKKRLAVAAFNNMLKKRNPHLQWSKSNVLIIGPTGSGKTHLVESLGKILNVPVYITDATLYTIEGYVGRSVSEIIDDYLDMVRQRVLEESQYEDAPRYSIGTVASEAQFGIIFIDEVDKLRATPERSAEVKDKGVQEALLKMIEGADVPASKKSRYDTAFSTHGILFVLGGAFSGIEDIIVKREHKQSIGFNSTQISKKDHAGFLAKLKPIDLIEYGLMPEFIGRVPVITTINKLTVDDLTKILTVTKNSITKQFEELFSEYYVTVEFEPEALALIAEEAHKLNLGARSLRTICEQILLDLQYNMPTIVPVEKFVITKQYVLDQLNKGR